MTVARSLSDSHFAEALGLELPGCGLLLAEIGPLKVGTPMVVRSRHRAKQVPICRQSAPHSVIVGLMQLFPGSVKQCLFDLQPELLKEVDFFII